jgi:hypothetical protein
MAAQILEVKSAMEKFDAAEVQRLMESNLRAEDILFASALRANATKQQADPAVAEGPVNVARRAQQSDTYQLALNCSTCGAKSDRQIPKGTVPALSAYQCGNCGNRTLEVKAA